MSTIATSARQSIAAHRLVSAISALVVIAAVVLALLATVARSSGSSGTGSDSTGFGTNLTDPTATPSPTAPADQTNGNVRSGSRDRLVPTRDLRFWTICACRAASALAPPLLRPRHNRPAKRR